jgi:uncharacterized membrane protein
MLSNKKLINSLTFGITVSIYAFFLVFYTAISLFRYYSYQIFYYDFGIFARIIWLLAHFRPPIIHHMDLGTINFLGDHFNPSLVIVAPLFWITSDLRILLIEQSFMTVMSGILIFLIARKYKLNYWLSLTISTIYLIYAGTANPLVTDWHTESTAGFFLLLFFYLFVFSNKKLLYAIAAIIFLGFKESNSLTLFFLSLFLLITCPKKRKELGVVIAVCIAWFFATTRIIIPFISKKPYLYTPKFTYSLIENLKNIFLNEAKQKLVTDSLISFGFLPLFSIAGLIPVLGELSIRFLPTESKFGDLTLGGHYNVFLGIFLAIATIVFLSRFSVLKKFHIVTITVCIYLLIVSAYTARKITRAPINLAINKTFWHELTPNKNIKKFISSVPKKGSITAQNNLLPHFIERNEEVYLLDKYSLNKNSDIIVFDTSPGQNPNNLWAPSYVELDTLIKHLNADSRYVRIPQPDPNYYLFVKVKKI